MSGTARRTYDVAIIGCGTAGPAAALFLTRAGHKVTVYERVAHPTPVGAGIVLQPTGQHVLERLGLREAVLGRGARIDRLECETLRRRSLFDLRYATLSSDLYGIGMHRGALFEKLFEAVQREVPALRLGVTVEDLRVDADHRVRLLDPDGAEVGGPHDLVIVADGARSHLRDDTSFPKRVRPYRYGALWFVADDPRGAFRDRLYQVVEGPQHMLGLLPTGLGPGEGTTPHVSLYWSLRVDAFDTWRRAGLAPWKDKVLRFSPLAEPVLAQIHDVDQVLFSSYQHVTMPRWHTRNVVYLGDAAHAMSPQLGQGCNLALMDAMVLADVLASVDGLPAALDAYTAQRLPHLRFYQFATRWLTPFFQGDVGLLGWLRDTFMPWAARVPPMNREMVRSMAGIKRGLVRPSLALAPMAVLPAAVSVVDRT